MRKNFQCESFAESLDFAINDIARRTVDLRRRHILIVPDRCTLTAERALCRRTGGAFDAYVTTWSRLTGEREGEYLPRKGSVMLVRAILESCGGELECYRRSRSAKGFASKMYDVISQLAVCGVTPEEILTDGDGGKSHDIALVYKKYLEATKGELTDASGRMILLAHTLEDTDFLANAVVYVACFDSYTTLMERILKIMEHRAMELRVYDTAAGESSRIFGEAELYSSPSTASAAKAVAARIAVAHRNGVPYDDMCVVTAAQHPDEIVRIFRENGIPYGAAEPLSLAEHPLGGFISCVMNAEARGYRTEDVIRLAKNPFSGTDKRDCDSFERYAVRCGIKYKRFFEPFSPDGAAGEYYEGAERVRETVADLLTAVSRADGFSEKLERIVDYAETAYPADLREADEGRASPTVKARELAALCSRLLGGAAADVVFDAFAEGMRETELAVRPRLRGAVEIGCERDFRARRFSHVFVTDFDSDKHPAVTADDGLLGDSEIVALRGRGTQLSPTTAEVNRRAADEFFMLLSGAKKIMLVYSEKAGDVLDVIQRGCVKFTESSWAMETAFLGKSCDPLDLAVYCPTENMIEERYLAALSESRESGDRPAWLEYARRLSPDAEKRVIREPLSDSAAAGRLMSGGKTSVSRLETYFSCPRKHYFQYALKLTEPEAAEFDFMDIGRIMHFVAEKYVSEAFDEPPEKAADRLLAEAVSETGKSEEDNVRMTRILHREAAGLCRAIRAQADVGSFAPFKAEAEIGDNGDFPGLTLDARGRKIVLGGRADRVDVCGDLVRLIDYKSGAVSFDLGKVRMCVKLQLPLYLAALRACGYRPAAAFYMPTRVDFSTRNPYALVGLCANSEEVLNAMDPDILAKRESALLEVKGKKNTKKPPYVDAGESEAQLNALIDYACAAAGGAAAEIADGYILPSPFTDSAQQTASACLYCSYAGCCAHTHGSRRSFAPALSFGGEK